MVKDVCCIRIRSLYLFKYRHFLHPPNSYLTIYPIKVYRQISIITSIISFTKEGVEEIINLQPVGNLAKAYQVKQVRGLILKYRLEV